MNNLLLNDAQQVSVNFLVSQLTRIETEVYAIKYRDIQYPTLVPVDNAGPEWIQGVTYFSSDMAGAARWFTGKADDVPLADVKREVFQSYVSLAAIGYEYDLQEINTARLVGRDLESDRAMAARRASEEMIDRVAILGDTTKNYTGLANNSTVTASTAPADGTAGATTFVSKTPDQILRDINTALTGIFTGTSGVEMADTLLLPYDVMVSLGTRRIDTVNQTTILEWVMRNNVYTLTTGQALTVRGVWGLETAGSGGISRMVAYTLDPTVLVLRMPMPFRFLPVYQTGPMRFDVPGIFRFGGVDVKRPKAMRYLDGV